MIGCHRLITDWSPTGHLPPLSLPPVRSVGGGERGGMCVLITAGPTITLCAGGEGDSEGHVL